MRLAIVLPALLGLSPAFAHMTTAPTSHPYSATPTSLAFSDSSPSSILPTSSPAPSSAASASQSSPSSDVSTSLAIGSSTISLLAPIVTPATAVNVTLLPPLPTSSGPSPTYADPPLPTNWVYRNPANVRPDPEWDVNAPATTREFWWTIDYAAGAPDGFPRRMTVVNGQFPGPLVEVNTGDRVIVHVTNYAHHGQSIHWHGLHQNGTAYMDGVPGIAQCLIRPNTTFTYDFTVDAQFGTYWWHSHESNTLIDGMTGGFIIHSPDEPVYQNIQYDEDRIIFLSDWLHDESQVVVDALLVAGFYYGRDAAPEGDAVLINGVGQGNCTAVRVPASCSDDLYAEVKVQPNKKYRFRLINSGTHHTFRFSIDGHPFDVVEADGTSISGATQIHEVPIAAGQRYSIIVETDQGIDGEAFWMRSRTAAQCIAGGFIEDALAKFRYVAKDTPPSMEDPESQPWPDLKDRLTEPCHDLDEYYPITAVNDTQPPSTVIYSSQFDSMLGRWVNTTGGAFIGFAFNYQPWQNTINQPLLLDIEQGRQLNASHIPSATFDQLGGADIIVNNIGPVSHPYHLHGRKFWIVARGIGNLTAADVPTLALNLTDTLIRDTLSINGNSYAVLRIVSDTPGVWPLHCHIGWHLAEGKLAAIVIQPAAIMELAQPAEWQQLCYGTDPNAFGANRRRSYPPQARLGSSARARP